MSLQLKYELYYSREGARNHAHHPPSAIFALTTRGHYAFVLVAVAIYLLCTWILGNDEFDREATDYGNADATDGGTDRSGSATWVPTTTSALLRRFNFVSDP